MGRVQIMLFVLGFMALSLRAEQFGTVDVFLAPNPDGLYSSLTAADYHVFTFELKNRGLHPAHLVLQLEVSNRSSYFRAQETSLHARQSVLLAPGSSQMLTLAVPSLLNNSDATSLTSDYALTVIVDGKAEEYNLGLHDREQSYIHDSDSVLLSNSLPQSELEVILSSGSYKDRLRLLKLDVPPRQWPRSPEFYFGKRIIFCSSTDDFPDDLRLLLQKWVFAGGILATCLPPDPSRSDKYPQLPDGWDIQPSGWGADVVCQPFNQEQMDKIAAFLKENNWSDLATSGGWAAAAGIELHPFWQNFEQSILPDSQKQPFQASNLLSQHQDYLSLPVPELNTRALLIIMMLFVIIIGPLNYYYFHRRRQKLRLLLSTPLLSFLFCLLVILFINFTEGWKATAQSVAITILDQNRGLATTKALCGIYSSTTLRNAFQFTAPDQLVFTNVKNLQRLDAPGQVYSASLVRPRIPVYYAVSRTESRQERLTCREVPEGLEVINGLGGPLEQLAVHWSENMCYFSTTSIAPGEKTILTRKIPYKGLSQTFSPQELAASAVPVLQNAASADSLQQLFDRLPVGYYAATAAEPLFFTPGHKLKQYSHKQLIVGF